MRAAMDPLREDAARLERAVKALEGDVRAAVDRRLTCLFAEDKMTMIEEHYKALAGCLRAALTETVAAIEATEGQS